jgi:peptide/nickel transport system substrate-binding protein
MPEQTGTQSVDEPTKEIKMISRTYKTFLATGLLSALLATTAVAQDEPRMGGVLSIAMGSDIRSLEPTVNRDSNTDNVLFHIFEGLVGYRADLSIGPVLAESWTVSDDGLSYSFTIREGAMFHNDEPVTSEDVKWSWERVNANAEWRCASTFEGLVSSVETPDPRTVVFNLSKPNALFLVHLSNVQCHILTAHPDSAAGEAWTPIGSGPFQLGEWRQGEVVSLTRFDGYVPLEEPASGYAGARVAYVDEVRFVVIPDGAAAEAALATGEIDVVFEPSLLRLDEIRAGGATVDITDGLSWNTLLIQTRDPLLSDPRIRRAIAHALDLETLATARTDGLAQGNGSAVPRSSAYFNEAFESWPAHDPEAARALLAEAGYDGTPIKLQTNSEYQSMFDDAVVMQAMMMAAGFTVELETLDWATQLDNYLAGNFQLQSFGYSARFDPGLMYGTIIGNKDDRKTSQWESDAAKALLDKANTTLDDAERGRIFEEMHALMATDVPIIGLYHSPAVEAYGPTVRGWSVWAANKPIAWNVWKTAD